MDIVSLINKKIRAVINVINIDIIDESSEHESHYFSPRSSVFSHIRLVLISDDFIGMNTLKRHRLIYGLLKNEIKQVHAISFRLYTSNEYNLRKVSSSDK
ncbi:MAG: BolA family transcriptional regulator [Wolbachia endosymbiont of Menacanthus eurysternus]|nr:MAG: BolA family transcriptional regulator [Wolbachia endosymbiont of Menacanthus eurysternus]